MKIQYRIVSFCIAVGLLFGFMWVEWHNIKAAKANYAEQVKDVLEETSQPNFDFEISKPIIEEQEPITEPEPEPYVSPIQLSDEERYVVECIVAGEAWGEPYEGKKAVAQCIYDAMLQDGLTASEVRKTYKYSGWKTNLPEVDYTSYLDVAQAVTDVFDFGEMATDEFILWFYNPAYGKSKFHESQNFVIEIGHHKFFSKKG